MSLSMTLRDIGDSIRSQPTRFALSFLAIGIGVISLVLLLAVLSALNSKSERLVQDLGVDVVGVLRLSPLDQNGGLSRRHAELLKRNFEDLTVSSIRRYTAPTLGTRQQLTVVATDDRLASVRGWSLAAGRFLDRLDVRDAQRNAVVTRALSEEWGWRVGNLIYLRDTPFTIVGIVNAGGSALDTEEGDPRLVLGDRVVLVPKTVLPYWDQAQTPSRGAIDALFVRGTRLSAPDLLPALRRVLQQPDQRVGKLAWVTPASLLREVNRLKKSIAVSAGTVSALCLLLGGTALMSLMVANVRDRITEIGLRRSLGATRLDIALLFALEAIAVTVAAGLFGTLLAHAVLLLTAGNWPVPVQAGPWSIAIPPLAAAVLGALFSYWPARTAASIPPSEALRNE
ncbi:MAG: ABC transporter permease [Arenicellales bacterium]